MTSQPTTASSRRSPARLVPLVLVEGAAGLSMTANAMLALVLPWLVLERTGSPTAAGVIATFTTLPMVLGALFSGTVIDIVGSRRAAIGADLLSAGSVTAIAVMDLSGGFTLWVLAALAFVGSLFDLSGVTARKVMLPEAAARAGLRLESANGIHESIKGLALVVGPSAGGLLIGLGGPGTALVVAAAAPALAVVATLLVRLPVTRLATTDSSSLWRVAWRSSREGLATVWRDPLLRLAALMGVSLYSAYLPIVGVVLPTYFHGQQAPERLGLLTMCLAVGGIVGAVLYTVAGHRIGRHTTFVTAMILGATGLLAMSFLPPYPVLLVLAGVVGMAAGPIGPLMNLASQCRSTTVMRGRVMGIMTSAGYVGGPVGYLVGGPLVDGLGPRTAFAVLAGVLFVFVLIASRRPALREFDSLSI